VNYSKVMRSVRHHPGHDRVRHIADGLLGVHVLASTTPAAICLRFLRCRRKTEGINWTDGDVSLIACSSIFWEISSAAGWPGFIGLSRDHRDGVFGGYLAAMLGAYLRGDANHNALLWWRVPIMRFLPGGVRAAVHHVFCRRSFPTLLRTTGAGFCYNIGTHSWRRRARLFFRLFSRCGDHRTALFYAGFLFLPAAVICIFLRA